MVRAEALSFLAWIPPTDGDLAAPVRLGEQALAEAGDDPALRAATHLRVGAIELIRGRLDVSAAHGRAAETIAREVDDDGLLTLTLASVGYIEMLRGAGIVAETRDAIGHRTDARRWPRTVSAGRGMILVGMTLTDCGELAEARTLLSTILARVTEAGNEVGRAGVLFHLAEVDRRAGNWEEASALSTRSRESVRPDRRRLCRVARRRGPARRGSGPDRAGAPRRAGRI